MESEWRKSRVKYATKRQNQFKEQRLCRICGKKPEHVSSLCDYHHLQKEISYCRRTITRIFRLLDKKKGGQDGI